MFLETRFLHLLDKFEKALISFKVDLSCKKNTIDQRRYLNMLKILRIYIWLNKFPIASFFL